MSIVEPDSKKVWRLVAVVVDGKDVPVGQSTIMEVTPEGYTVKVNGKVYQRGMTRSDPGKSPRETDVLVAEGPNAGQTLPQIDRIDGNVLIGCQAKPGAPRPSTFESTPGSGQTLSVWLQDEKALQLSKHPAGMGQWYAILPVLFVADNVEASEAFLTPSLGRWGSLAAIGLGLAAIQFVVCLLLRWGWRAGVAYGLTIALAILVDKELTHAIEPALGHSGSVLVALSTAVVAGIVTWQVISRLLRVNA